MPVKFDRSILTGRAWVRGRLSVYWEPRDLWVGVYVARDAVYVCPVPTVVLRWTPPLR